MDKLPPIPTPAGQRWHTFRIRGLPMLIFAVVAVMVAFLWKGLDAPSGIGDNAGAISANVLSARVGTAPPTNASLHSLVSIPDDVK